MSAIERRSERALRSTVQTVSGLQMDARSALPKDDVSKRGDGRSSVPQAGGTATRAVPAITIIVLLVIGFIVLGIVAPMFGALVAGASIFVFLPQLIFLWILYKIFRAVLKGSGNGKKSLEAEQIRKVVETYLGRKSK